MAGINVKGGPQRQERIMNESIILKTTEMVNEVRSKIADSFFKTGKEMLIFTLKTSTFISDQNSNAALIERVLIKGKKKCIT